MLLQILDKLINHSNPKNLRPILLVANMPNPDAI